MAGGEEPSVFEPPQWGLSTTSRLVDNTLYRKQSSILDFGGGCSYMYCGCSIKTANTQRAKQHHTTNVPSCSSVPVEQILKF